MDNGSYIEVSRHDGVKCPRCWHYHYVESNYDHLCDRCCNTILDTHPEYNLEVTSGILESFRQQRGRWGIETSDKIAELERQYLTSGYLEEVEKEE